MSNDSPTFFRSRHARSRVFCDWFSAFWINLVDANPERHQSNLQSSRTPSVAALAHLGFWQTVDKAPYDQLQAQDGTRDFVSDLPGGEQDYWDACRSYMDVLYGRMLRPPKIKSDTFSTKRQPMPWCFHSWKRCTRMPNTLC